MVSTTDYLVCQYHRLSSIGLYCTLIDGLSLDNLWSESCRELGGGSDAVTAMRKVETVV